MITLVNTVAAAIGGLTAGEMFTSNQENQVEIAIHPLVVPPKEQGAEDVPFCWVYRADFATFPRPTVQIAARFVLFEADLAQAADEAQRLTELLKQLARRGTGWAPWKLDAVHGYEGEKDTNLHPPDHRQYTYLLEFSGTR